MAEKKKEVKYSRLAQRISAARLAKTERIGENFTQGHVSAKFFDLTDHLVNVGAISDWEQGYTRPEPDNLHTLARILEVPYEEEIYWLGLTGYLPPTRMPSAGQLEPILDIYYDSIKDYPYPALILDHRNTIWAINPAAVGLLGGYEAAVYMMKRMTNLFEIMFDSQLGFIEKLAGLEEFQRRQIRAFLLTNLHRRHEPFWESYPTCWQSKLTEYEQFEKLWRQICSDNPDAEAFSEKIVEIMAYSSSMDFALPNGPAVKFEIITESPGYFYHNLFQIIRYLPNLRQDHSETDTYFEQYLNCDASNLKLWTVRRTDEILATLGSN